MEKHIIEPIGDRYIDEITADDLKMLMVPVSKMSKGLYGTVNMLLKCVFYSAIESDVIRDNPAACINPRGGKSKKEKVALTDKQIATLLDTIKDLPPHLFVMLGLYSGLRREEILGLQWDCVHIDEEIPYISVRRAWRSVKNRPEVTTLLKTPAARRDIPIPQILVDCLKAEKEKSSWVTGSESLMYGIKGNKLRQKKSNRNKDAKGDGIVSIRSSSGEKERRNFSPIF